MPSASELQKTLNTELPQFFNSWEGRKKWGHPRCLPANMFPLSTVRKMHGGVLGDEHRSGKTLAVAPLTYAGSGEHKEVPQPPKASSCTRSSRLCSYCNLVCPRFLG